MAQVGRITGNIRCTASHGGTAGEG